MTAKEIELKLASYLNYRVNLIVPNVSWGMGFIHECDLLVITPSGYAWEIEIKTNLRDLIRDQDKVHQHKSNRISRLYFALDGNMNGYLDYIPERAGIFIVGENGVRKVREAQVNHNYRWTIEERYHLAKLGSMRVWRLKRILNKKPGEKN